MIEGRERSIGHPWHMLKELADQLGLANTLKAAGRALHDVARLCGVSRFLIVGPPSQDDGPLLFDSNGEAGLAGGNRPAEARAISIAGAAVPEPLLVSSGPIVDLIAGGSREASVAFVVPVRIEGQTLWCAIFEGRREIFDEATRAILSVGVHAAHSRLLEAPPRRAADLTAREQQVLEWIASGKTDIEVGAILGISPRTVRFHVSNIKRKLGVVTRIQAVALQMRAG